MGLYVKIAADIFIIIVSFKRNEIKTCSLCIVVNDFVICLEDIFRIYKILIRSGQKKRCAVLVKYVDSSFN